MGVQNCKNKPKIKIEKVTKRRNLWNEVFWGCRIFSSKRLKTFIALLLFFGSFNPRRSWNGADAHSQFFFLLSEREKDLAKGRKACYSNQSKSDFIYLHPSIPPFGYIYASPIYMYIYQRRRKNKSKSNHCRRRWKKIWCWNQPTIVLYDLHEIKNNMVFES